MLLAVETAGNLSEKHCALGSYAHNLLTQMEGSDPRGKASLQYSFSFRLFTRDSN